MTEEDTGTITFGRYELLYLIGEGGMAEIFLAVQRGLEDISKTLVVKRMLPHLTRDKSYVDMFLDEARLAARLSHPNVVQIFDFGELEGRYYLAMEYLAGENLAAVANQASAKDERIPFPVVLQVAIATCDGLHYAHDFSEAGKPMNIVHRDVTPSNVMVTYQGGIKLVDFGIARAADRQQERTQTGIVKGKVAYCSPEQLECLKLDRRTDIFALGTMIHELTCGRRLFRRDSDAATVRSILMGEIPRLSEEFDDVPPELDAILEKAIARDRDKRYSTALDLRRDLEALVSGPVVRLDDYMEKLFGTDRARRRIEVPTSLSSITALSDVTGAQLMTPAKVARDAKIREDSTEAIMPTEDVSEVLEFSGGHDLFPGRRRKVLLASVLGVALAGVLVWAQMMGFLSPDTMGNNEVTTGRGSNGAAVAENAGTSMLKVDTLPRGARIEVGDRMVEGSTPVTVKGLSAGDVVVRASLEGYADKTSVVTIEADRVRSIVMELVPSDGVLNIKTMDGATVIVDGDDHGVVTTLNLAPGKHQIEIRHAGYRTFSRTIMVTAGNTAKISAKLTRASRRASGPTATPVTAKGQGKLDVTCRPWCRVFLDGKDVGRPSPIVGLSISAGEHELKMEHPPTGRSKEIGFKIAPGQRLRKSASFR